jgi:hypothetical protein
MATPTTTNSRNTQRTQRSRLLGLLVAARGGEVSLRQILDLRISQFGSRLLELRALGFEILNRMEIVGGEKRSWYRLVSGPSVPMPVPTATGQQLNPTLFDISGVHRDEG